MKSINNSHSSLRHCVITGLLIVSGFYAFAQKPQPIQIQTIQDSTYVVEYIPITVAQKNVAAQLVQVDKQLQTIDKQIAELVKKRDDLMQQQAALEYIQKQLAAATDTPPPPVKEVPTAPPPAKEKKVKPKKDKN